MILILVLACVATLVFILPSLFIPAIFPTPLSKCLTNLRVIQAAKEMYAEEHGLLTNGTIVTDLVLESEQISSYMKEGFTNLVCPCGGHYSVNKLSELPTCSYVRQNGSHRLADDEK